MKKIFLTILLLIFSFSFSAAFAGNVYDEIDTGNSSTSVYDEVDTGNNSAGGGSSDCVPPEGDFNVSDALENCLSESDLVNTCDASITGGFGEYITTWTNNIALYLGIFAVFAIVFGSFNLTISAGDDEKINKSKKIIQWGIIGFIGVISASLIINLIIRIIYDLS